MERFYLFVFFVSSSLYVVPISCDIQTHIQTHTRTHTRDTIAFIYFYVAISGMCFSNEIRRMVRYSTVLYRTTIGCGRCKKIEMYGTFCLNRPQKEPLSNNVRSVPVMVRFQHVPVGVHSKLSSFGLF